MGDGSVTLLSVEGRSLQNLEPSAHTYKHLSRTDFDSDPMKRLSFPREHYFTSSNSNIHIPFADTIHILPLAKSL